MFRLVSNLTRGPDGIYGHCESNLTQSVEIELRKRVAEQGYEDYFDEILKHHSSSVMRAEVASFLQNVEQNGVIVDVGGCWGWHWLPLRYLRRDVKVVIVDFVRENLLHAKKILGDEIDSSIFLVHGDAVALDFPDNSFDGYWTVQTTQHIPDLTAVYNESFRVLKKGGVLADYTLNDSIFGKLVSVLSNNSYVTTGHVESSYFLRRGTCAQQALLADIFKVETEQRFSEILFTPEIKLYLGSKNGSVLGRIDSFLSRNSFTSASLLGKLLGRQRSFHLTKPE